MSSRWRRRYLVGLRPFVCYRRSSLVGPYRAPPNARDWRSRRGEEDDDVVVDCPSLRGPLIGSHARRILRTRAKVGPLACEHAWTIRAEVARRAGEKWCLCGSHSPDRGLRIWGRSRAANEEVTRRKGDNGKRIRYPLLLNS